MFSMANGTGNLFACSNSTDKEHTNPHLIQWVRSLEKKIKTSITINEVFGIAFVTFSQINAR